MTSTKDTVSSSPSPQAASLSEQLLVCISRLQECEDARQFCRTAVEELCRIFPQTRTAWFVKRDGEPASREIMATAGKTPKADIPAGLESLLDEALKAGAVHCQGTFLVIPLVRGADIPAVILLQSGEAWHLANVALLEQFAKSAARGLETTALLQEARLLAYRDVLTSLGNRLSFKKEIQAEINRSRSEEEKRFAVVQFVIDTLPELNIALGHEAGDALLRGAAGELDRLFPKAIALARTSGDGFGVCTPIQSNEEIGDLPDIINDLFDVFLPDELDMPHLVPRIGVSLYPMDGASADQLWQNTNIALAHTKNTGSPNFCYYDNHIETEIHGRITLNNALRDGMNLVAKEYVTARTNNDGALVLSEFAGAADQLKQALLMNPHDIDGLKDTIMKAVNMQPAEAARRMRAMRKQILDHDVDLWSSDFLNALKEKVIRDDS